MAEAPSPFELQFQVAPSDIDGLGHANNIAYVRWIQDIAVAHSSSVGLTWEAYRELGGCFVVRRHEIDYLRAAVEGDPLAAITWITDVKAASCVRHTELRHHSSGKPIARGKTSWVFVDLASGKPIRIPRQVMAAFGHWPIGYSA